jgi:hypothetical protein
VFIFLFFVFCSTTITTSTCFIFITLLRFSLLRRLFISFHRHSSTSSSTCYITSRVDLDIPPQRPHSSLRFISPSYHLLHLHLSQVKMSGRLDQSLDSIIDSQKKAKREQQRRRKPIKKAPVGGVKKATKPVKPAVKPAGGAGGQSQASKIVVSGLVSLISNTSHHLKLTPLSPTTSMRPKSRYVDTEAYGPWIPIDSSFA